MSDVTFGLQTGNVGRDCKCRKNWFKPLILLEMDGSSGSNTDNSALIQTKPDNTGGRFVFRFLAHWDNIVSRFWTVEGNASPNGLANHQAPEKGTEIC